MARTSAQRLAVLETQRDQIDDRITELTAQLAPDVSDQGRSVQWNSLLATLMERREKIEKLIAQASGPVRVTSWGKV